MQRDPYYRLQSWDEIEIAAELGLKIDVNRATVDDWLRLPGLSIHQARTLVELSGTGVQFLCLEDLAAAGNIPLSHLQRLDPLLQFIYYDPDSVLFPQKINLNTATVQQLAKIPQITDQFAQSIVKQRQQQGKYRNLAEFQQRFTLDSDFLRQLMHYLHC
ncbi:ComEA family DNA-binding protein [Spirulina sp. CS-785/01]|uniref:ComEA family DNA-binding protein n=1 Tax=Spirulina sp. CS-785/01 TaxID=3021716 RepID=UPI0023315980|nr:ComEA family DNA-binding protein [Spirulina sp. CS-785/01]MDB9312436.1 ComEA family DNA-binding protein [Spirulina sp. CS-785/01]